MRHATKLPSPLRTAINPRSRASIWKCPLGANTAQPSEVGSVCEPSVSLAVPSTSLFPAPLGSLDVSKVGSPLLLSLAPVPPPTVVGTEGTVGFDAGEVGVTEGDADGALVDVGLVLDAVAAGLSTQSDSQGSLVAEQPATAPTSIAILKLETRRLFTASTSLSVTKTGTHECRKRSQGSKNHADETASLRRAWNSTHENVSLSVVRAAGVPNLQGQARIPRQAPGTREGVSQQRRAIDRQHATPIGGEVHRLSVRAEPRIAFVGVGVQAIERHHLGERFIERRTPRHV